MLPPFFQSNDVGDLCELNRVVFFIEFSEDLFFDIFNEVIHAAHQVLQVALKLVVVGVFGEG